VTPRIVEKDMVRRLRAMQPTSTSRYVFASRHGHQLSHFKDVYFKAVRQVGLAGSGLGVHSLRHTWASRLVESGADLVTVQRLGGWASLAMVQRYSHLRPGRDVEALNAMLALRESHQTPHAARMVVPLKG
jgi:site-specific recombinase XerD